MKDFFYKYLKYKIKYFEIKYGGKRDEAKEKKKRRNILKKIKKGMDNLKDGWEQIFKNFFFGSSSEISTPKKKSSPIQTPIQTPKQNIPTSVSSIKTEPPTPKFRLNASSIQAIISLKEELLCKLTECLDDSEFKITAKEKKEVQHHFYINFKKNGKDYAHFSFHFPDESKEAIDIFEVDTLHLKLDINKNIVFNLVKDDEKYKLKSNMTDSDIKRYIGEEEFKIVRKIIECFEGIFNTKKYIKIFDEPTAKRLVFD